MKGLCGRQDLDPKAEQAGRKKNFKAKLQQNIKHGARNQESKNWGNKQQGPGQVYILLYFMTIKCK